MTRCWRRYGFPLMIASSVLVGGEIASSGDYALAQITPDGTLPNNSIVTSQGNTSQISGGTRSGSNLFHSFEQFSIPTGGAAYFNNGLDIQNIISRVTGESISNIDGLIRANGTANLFLLNPNGIIFGPNASLNIGGSFVGSTASGINFADGTKFSATVPQAAALLTVSVPIGLQFGGNAGSILVEGNGQGIRTTPDLIDTTVGLRVQPDQTLALVGGDVALEGGTLKTAGGRIELGSVAGASLVSLTPTDVGWSLGYEGVQNFRNIQLSQQAAVDASGAGSGNIQVRGRRVTLSNGSQIEAATLGSNPGGTLTIRASELVELIGSSADGHTTALAAPVYREATGAGGNLTLETRRLIVRDGAQILAGTFGAGSAGTVAVNASESVEVIGTSADGQASQLSTSVQPIATGAGGNLTLETRRLLVRDGAQIGADTFGAGSAGTLAVNASESVKVIGTSADGQASQLSTSVQSTATGDGGNLTLETRRLIVRDGAQILAGTFGAGSAGTLAVNASESVEVIGTSADGQDASQLSTSVGPIATGAGGNLTLKTQRLIVRDGAQIGASTFGAGSAGTLAVNASESVEVIGRSADGLTPSGLFTQVDQEEATGAGGNLTVETRRLIVRDGALIFAGTYGKEKGGDLVIASEQLTVRDGAQIGASTFGAGSAGTLAVNASESVEVIGRSADGLTPSGLVTGTQGTGNAGDLTIETEQLTVRDGAGVIVNSEGSGSAGNLRVAARSIHLNNRALLSSNTTAGQGNINLYSEDLVLRRESVITTNAIGPATGGNITIDTDILAALGNSDISANAQEAFGGRVIIDAQGIFGTEFRNQTTPESDITATSELGAEFSGTVEINTPDVDPSQGLATLPAELVDASRLIASSCGAGGKNEFIVTGRGGVPPNPSDPLSSDTVWSDLRYRPQLVLTRLSSSQATNPTNSAPTQIVEAQGWMINDKGSVVLTATVPNVTPHNPWIPSATCHTPQASS